MTVDDSQSSCDKPTFEDSATPSKDQLNNGDTPDDEDSAEDYPGIDFTDPNSPLARYYMRVSDIFAVVLLLIIFLFYSLAPVWHSDIWGHIKFGQWIVENRTFPDKVPFSHPFTDNEAAYIHFQWLAQVVFFVVFRAGELLSGGDELNQLAGGATLLRGLHGLLTVLRCGAIFVAMRRLTGSTPLACMGVLFLVFSTSPSLYHRPQKFGELFFALLFVPLARPILSKRSLFLIPLVLVLWANCHGSFVLGLVLLGIFLVGRGIESCRKQAKLNPIWALFDKNVQRLALVLLLSVVAIAILNLHGPFIYWHVLKLSHHPNVADMEEWKSLRLSLEPGGHWGYLAVLLVLVVSQILAFRWFSPLSVLLLVTFAPLPFYRGQRMMTWWLMLAPWIILPAWKAIGDKLPWRWLHYQSVPSLRKTVIALAFVLMALIIWVPTEWLIRGRRASPARTLSPGTPWQLGWQLRYPSKTGTQGLPRLHKALKAYYPSGRYTGTIFASEPVGDYLHWYLPAKYPVMMHSHVHLIPEKHWRNHVTVLYGRKNWANVLDEYQVNLVVIEPLLRVSLANKLRRSRQWIIILDESKHDRKPNIHTRLLIALRKSPVQ